MDSPFEAYAGKTVLITGGAGAIGSNLAHRLAELETERIIILDNLSSSYAWNVPRGPNIQFIKGDILDEEMLRFAFKTKPDVVFHLAAHFANQNSVDYPETDLMVNGLGMLKVLQYSHLSGVERFVYTSSGCGVYGVCSTMPFEEHDVSISLHSPYQVTKLLGELYTNCFYNLYGLPIVNVRLFNVYGPGEVPGKYRNVIPNFFYWAMKGQALPITGDGTETRDWTFVDDAVNGLLAGGVTQEAVGEAINIGSGAEHRVVDMARIVNKLTGNKSGIQHTERRDWDAKPQLLSSIDKARRLIGYQPQVTFKDGLRKVHEWFVENWENIEESAEF
ncbi:MAG: NAD-dependent epimerase/dehydratase family protein [Halobacteriota archaeon]